MNNDVWQSLIRRLVSMLAGALISHGVISAGSVNRELIETVSGALLALGTTVWSVYHQNKMKVQSVCPTQPDPTCKLSEPPHS